MTEFLTGNEWWGLARTVAQGVLGVLMANLELLTGTLEQRAQSSDLLEVQTNIT